MRGADELRLAGGSVQRTGLWNYDAQPFADGMFYTGCSRSTSAAGLKVFSSLGEYNLNKVDFQLLGVRPRVADDVPPPETVEPPADPAPPHTPIVRSPWPEPMDLTRTPLPSHADEQMDELPPLPTPSTVVSAMDWENPADPTQPRPLIPPENDRREPPRDQEPVSEPTPNPPTDPGNDRA